jgi:hypothetical protein
MNTFPLPVESRFISTLFRGAKNGLNQFVGGSFYTADAELAESYAKMEKGTVYEVNVDKRMNLLVVDATEDIDDLTASECITDNVLEQLDGAIYENRTGDQTIVVLFDRVSIDGSVTKLTLSEKRADIAAAFRRYDR